MVVSISLVLLLGGLIAILVRYGVVRRFELILCGSFGFLLADTGLGPWLHSVLGWFGTILGTIHP